MDALRPFLSCPIPVAIRLAEQGPGTWRYRLHGLWQLHLYAYEAEAEIGGRRLRIRPGSAGLTPPGAEMHYRLIHGGIHTYAHFRASDATAAAGPQLFDLGRASLRTEEDLREAIPWMATDPRRAGIRLWDVLGRLAGPGDDAPRQLLDRARARIERMLPRAVGVAWLAGELGCTREHLARTFRRELGSTVVAYVRARRLALAMHLLRSSTRPMREIAAEIGVADLQAFNKLIRRHAGLPPRALRRGGGG